MLLSGLELRACSVTGGEHNSKQQKEREKMRNSRRISVRTMKYGLIMEWTAKLCILLPFCLVGKTFGDAVMCFLLGGAVWGVVVTLMSAGMGQSRSVNRVDEVCRYPDRVVGFGNLSQSAGETVGLCKHPDRMVGFSDLSQPAGRAAGVYGVTVQLFCAAQAAVFVRLGAELAAQYLLPRTAASERAVERLMLQNPSAGFAARHVPYQAAVAGQSAGQMMAQATAAGQSASQMMTQAAATGQPVSQMITQTAATGVDAQHLSTRTSATGFGTQGLPSQALIMVLCLVVFAVAAYFALRRYRQEKIAEAAQISAASQVKTGMRAERKVFENSRGSNYTRVQRNIWRERYRSGGLCVIAGAAVAGGMVLLAVLCASGAASWTAGSTAVRDIDSILRGSFEVFACLGGVSLPVLYRYMETENGQEGELMWNNQKNEKSRKPMRQQALCAVRRAGRLSLVLSGFVCAAAIAFYGSGGVSRILFPAVSMMGELRPTGILPQHPEQIFALLLFACTVAAAASALCLMLRLTARLYPVAAALLAGLRSESDLPGVSAPEFPETQPPEVPGTSTPEFPETSMPEFPGAQPSEFPGTSAPESPGTRPPEILRMPSGFSRTVRRFQWAALAVVCLASAGFSSGLSAISYYRAWNMQLLVPLMLILYGWYCAARRCQRVRVMLDRQPARL